MIKLREVIRRFTRRPVTARIAAALSVALFASSALAVDNIEKPELKFGFIKLTDCAPLVIAYEKGFFEDEGLYVSLEAQANWKVLLDGVIDGRLDRFWISHVRRERKGGSA